MFGNFGSEISQRAPGHIGRGARNRPRVGHRTVAHPGEKSIMVMAVGCAEASKGIRGTHLSMTITKFRIVSLCMPLSVCDGRIVGVRAYGRLAVHACICVYGREASACVLLIYG